MHFITIAAISALTATALAAPAPEQGRKNFPYRPNRWGPHGHGGPPAPFPTGAPAPEPLCLGDDTADALADVFRALIQEYSDEIALEWLTEDFVDYSSSVNIIINQGAEGPKNLTEPTFSGRQAFMDGQGSQPEIPFTKLQIFHGCDSVSMRWLTSRSASGQATEVAMLPVVGNVIIEAVPATDNEARWRIKTIYSEFNAAAWLVNLGVFDPEGPVTPAKRSIDEGYRGGMI